MQDKLYSLPRLRDYALWYYFRYYPSNKRLLQKLEEKGSKEDSEKVFSDIKHLLQEAEIIASKIDNYIFRNKNYKYIRQKMFQKGFPKESVEQYLEKYTESGKSILDTDFFQRKIDSYARKGKSRKFIFQTLSETTEDREILEGLLDIYFVDGETKNIEKHYKKLLAKLTSNLSVAKRGEKGSTFLRQRIIQKLLEKGFQYDDIKNIVM